MNRTFFLLFFSILLQAAIGQQGNETLTIPAGPKNIILLIGDGMGVSQVYAGMTANKGHLNIAEFKDIGFSMTYSAAGYITDSGAGGTAIATGKKTFDQAIGLDQDSLPAVSILHYAEAHGKATGLVATSQVTHATPASFIAHQINRYDYEDIALDFLRTDIDVFIGGGLDHFRNRKDGADLTRELGERGYNMAYNLDELREVREGKLAGLLYPDKPPRLAAGRGDMLLISAVKAIEILEQDPEGFFLMIEGSQIDWGGHDNDTDYLIEELLDFDKTVGMALEYAKNNGNTLVIVTADHETGGMSLIGGDIEAGIVEARYSATDHTGVMVPVFAYGPGSGAFRGIFENTDLFLKMMAAFGFKMVINPS